MQMKRTHAIWLLAGLVTLGGASAWAADMPERELGLLLGGGWADKDLVGGKDDEVNPLFGLRYGQRLGTSTNFFGDLVYGPYDGNRAGVGDADVTTLRGGLEWLFSKQQRYNWFLAGGLGLMNVNTDSGPDFTRPMASLGIGQAWEVGANDAFRWEVRADQSFGNDTLPNAGLTNFQALLGYSWGIGAPLDSDGDGVANRLDQCPDTPKGAKVDTKGCPLDSDGDGVFDGLDKCPDTPAGVKVNAEGCPLDSDGDGIPDYQDKCPTVPAPGTVDGCPPPPAARPAEPEAPMAAPEAPRKLTLEGVNFDSDSARLRPESLAILDNAAATLKEWGEVKVEVAGHTDSTNSDAYNLRLSQRRAEAVRAYLIKQGVAADRLTAKGYGESSPVADNKTAAGRYKNRRVELIPQQ
jgi:OOP family OmpA-OmpF porin